MVVDVDKVICVVEFCRGFDAVVVVDTFSVVERSVVDAMLEAVDVDVFSVVNLSTVDMVLDADGLVDEVVSNVGVGEKSEVVEIMASVGDIVVDGVVILDVVSVGNLVVVEFIFIEATVR